MMEQISRKSLTVGIALLSAACLLGGCGEDKKEINAAPRVKTQQILTQRAAGAASYAGEVRGRYESQLSFQIGGKIMARNVELGSKVRAGDLMMQIDPKDAAESLNMGAAQVASAKAQLSLAEANLQRYRQLYEQQAVSASLYDQYKTSCEAAQAAYRQAQAQYAQSGNALDYTRLSAESDGVISAVNAETGQVVAAGQSVLTLVQTEELEVEMNIPENRLAQMQPGQTVQVAFWALENQLVSGVVREVSPMADPVARTYKARISLPQPPQNLQLGMTARVSDAAELEADAIFLPLAAIYQTGKQPQVWIVEENAVTLRDIAIEAFGDNQVKVTAGLKRGDIVVTAGVHKLLEGQRVRLMEGEQP